MSAIQKIAIGHGQVVILLPSITQLSPEHEGAVIVTGSHGGISVVEYALRIPVKAVFFNNAGVGKERAGIRALDALDAVNIAAAAYSHDSACIGDAQDGWSNGIVSHVNARARQGGVAVSHHVRVAVMVLEQSAALKGA